MAGSLPDLSKLVLNEHSAIIENATDGEYCLDRVEHLWECRSKIVVVRNAVLFSPEMTQELEEFMSNETNVPKTKTRYNKFVLRRQATFGAAYNFGQDNATIPYPVESWPQAVQLALQTAKEVATQLQIDPELYNAVHANWYPNGKSGVDPHSDKETEMVKGKPIISFTLLAGNIVPRNFSILRPPNAAEIESQQNNFEQKQNKYYTKREKKAVELNRPPPPHPKTSFKPEPVLLYNVKLGHGDMLIMKGDMQTYYLHSVPKDTRKELQHARRLNLTVRAFQQTAS